MTFATRTVFGCRSPPGGGRGGEGGEGRVVFPRGGAGTGEGDPTLALHSPPPPHDLAAVAMANSLSPRILSGRLYFRLTCATNRMSGGTTHATHVGSIKRLHLKFGGRRATARLLAHLRPPFKGRVHVWRKRKETRASTFPVITRARERDARRGFSFPFGKPGIVAK